MADWWADPGLWLTILTILGIGGGFFWWAHKTLSKHEREHAELLKIPARLDRVDATLSDIRFEVGALVLREQDRDKDFLANIERLKRLGHASGNPYDPARKAHLLDLYKDRTISLEEAEELQRYLQEDAQGATVGGGLLLILLALAGLGALIYLLSQAGRRE